MRKWGLPFQPRWYSPKNRAERKKLKQTLRQQNYDLVIDAQALIKSALVASWAKAPIAGFDYRSIRTESIAA